MSYDNNRVLIDSIGGTAYALATTGQPVSVIGSAPPLAGDSLVATSSITATWQNIAGGATGQNVGTSGVGVFRDKIGTTLNFKKLNPVSSKISVVGDIVNSKIDFDVVTGFTSSTVAIGNDARFSTVRVIKVKESNAGSGEFTSIAAAIASIGATSPTNQYLIDIGPGTFTEPELTLPDNVSMKGANIITTIIQPNTANHHIINLGNGCELSFMTLRNAGTGFAAINVSNCGDYAQVHKLSINNSYIGIKFTASTIDSFLYVEYVDVSVLATIGYDILSSGGFVADFTLEDSYIIPDAINPTYGLRADGPNAAINITSCGFRGVDALVGTAIFLQNGATLSVQGLLLETWFSAIETNVLGAGNDLRITAADLDFCTNQLTINNASDVGSFTGSLIITRVFININSLFEIRDRDTNVFVVSKSGSDFTDIVTAVASINPIYTASTTIATNILTSSAGEFNITLNGTVVILASIPAGTIATFVTRNTMTLSNPATVTATLPAQFIRATITNSYVIKLGQGIFSETQTITMPENSSVIGTDPFNSIIVPTGAFDMFHMSKSTELSNINIQNVVDPNYSVVIDDVGVGVVIKNIILNGCAKPFHISSLTRLSQVAISDIICTGVITTGVTITDNLSGFPMLCVMTNFIYQGQATTLFSITGPAVIMSLKNSNMIGDGTGIGIDVSNGSSVSLLGIEYQTFSTAFRVQNVGIGPNMHLNANTFTNNTIFDINILHPGTTGVISALAARSKVFIEPTSTVSIEYIDPEVNGKIIIGSIFLGSTNATAADVSPLLGITTTMGLLSGGLITINAGLTINISSGIGYCTTGTFPNVITHKLIWNNSSLLLPASTTSYIYFDSSNILTSNVAKPNILQNVLLGRVRTDGANIEFIDATPMDASHISNEYDNYNRDVFGPIFASGSIVTANASRELAVSSGKYYLSENAYNPSGHISPTPFTTYFHSAGVFTKITGVTIVNNTQYDNGANLVALTAGFFAKHSLYLVGDGANEQYLFVFAQEEHALIGDARSGSLALPPTYFNEGVVIIANIIVQEGVPAFTEIRSERPLPIFAPSAIASTVDHGSLLGLLDDDHPQYLLTNGTRAMAADLNMGTFAITNVGLVDGVDIPAHAARHLPTGADSLTTAAPTTNLSATTTNSVGIQNSFARSDHGHAISTGVPSTQLPDFANATGISANLARADHIHNIPTATAVSITSANAQGALSSFARSDHTHQGVHSLKANSGGAQRFNDIILQEGAGITIVDNPAGTFTIDTLAGANELFVTDGGGLNVNYTAGTIIINGTITSIIAGTIALTNNTTGIIYVDTLGTVTQSGGTTTYPSNSVPMATYTTLGGIITVLIDDRTFINNVTRFGLVADITNITATGVASAGVSDNHARSDHAHTISTGVASSQTPDQANATGISANLARADHIHNITTAAPTTNLSATTTNTQGVATTFARSDHGHAISTGVVSTQTPDQANATGSSANLARADHVHNIPTATAVSIATTNAQGVAASFARSDHAHQGVHSLNANAGAQRFGDPTLQNGTGITVTDNGAGIFTFDTVIGPNELFVTNGGGLNANYTAGRVNINGIITNIIAGTIALTASTTNGTIFVNTSGVVSQSVSTVFAPCTAPMAIYTTSGVAITSLTDKRTLLNNQILGLPEIIDYVPIPVGINTGTGNAATSATLNGAIYTIIQPVSFSRIVFRVVGGSAAGETTFIAIYQASGGVSGNMSLIASGSLVTATNNTTFTINFGSTVTLSPGICAITYAQTVGAGLTLLAYAQPNTILLNNTLLAGTYPTAFTTALAPPQATLNPATQGTAASGNIAIIARLLA